MTTPNRVDFLLHTIALEPARWTPRKVSQSLASLAPHIAAAGFERLEVYEPHLSQAEDEGGLPALLAECGLTPVVLSSYSNFSPRVTGAEDFLMQVAQIEARVQRFGFKKLRLFPGMGMHPADHSGEKVLIHRIRALAGNLPGVEILLETRYGSIADNFRRMVEFVQDVGRDNVGLLFQPTVFDRELVMIQLMQQKPWIRHLHLQNRTADGRYAKLLEGVAPWAEIFAELGYRGAASIEFVPAGICEEAEFNLERTLQEAVSEMESVRQLDPLVRWPNYRKLVQADEAPCNG